MTEIRPSRHQPNQDGVEFAGPLRLSTVVASAPGIMAQSLRATIESLPVTQILGMAAGCLSALQMVRDGNADLVVIDANLPFEDVQMFLQELKNEHLPTQSLVLVNNGSHARRALAAGADIVFRRDGSTRQLGALVATLGRDWTESEPGL